jgi:hypothetical protein
VIKFWLKALPGLAQAGQVMLECDDPDDTQVIIIRFAVDPGQIQPQQHAQGEDTTFDSRTDS